MQTIDERYEDMWSDLESDFEQGEALPLPLELPDPPSRQRTVDVANLQSVFSGFYPVLGLCIVAGVAGVGDVRETLLLGVVCLMAFPLAALFSPTMRGAKRGWWYYSLTAVLVGGVGELTVTVSEALLRFSLSSYFSMPDFISTLQHQMEGFYRLDRWVLYLLLGLGVAYLTDRTRSRVPWMDSPRTGRLHGLVAACLLALPLLLPLSCFILGRAFWPQTGWHLRTERLNPQIQQSRSYESTAWSEVSADWWRAYKGPWDERLEQTSLPMLHKIEASYLELARSGRVRPDLEDGPQRALLSRNDELKEPYQVARTMASQATVEHLAGVLIPGLESAWETFLASACTHQLSSAEGQSLLKDLQTYDESVRNPTLDVDRQVLAAAHSPFWREKDMSVTLFGTSFNHSPEQLYFLYHNRFPIQDWIQIREQIPYDKSPEQEIAILRQQVDGDAHFLEWLATKPFDYELRPLWRAAAVITASQLYKLDNDSWPKHVSDIDSLLWFEANFSLTESSEGLKIQDNSSNKSWVLK
jgi:hypothetical protein